MTTSIAPASGKLSSLVEPITLVRMIAGFCYLPHVYAKIVGFAGTVGFFKAAGFPDPAFFVVLSGTMEFCIGVCLLFNLFTKYAAFVSIGLMLVAAVAQMSAKGIGWYWNLGGVEYLIYWAIASLAVFIDAWRKNPGFFGLFKDL